MQFNRQIKIFSVIFVLAIFLNTAAEAAQSKAPAKNAAALEKEKAKKNPYANDLGPDTIPADTLAAYEKHKKGITTGYKILTSKNGKCQTCHTASRVLNSQFIEPEGADLTARNRTVLSFKKTNPEFFTDQNIWQIEPDIWQRYVKRMMAKPGCGISQDEGKKIWEFLAYDSVRRKLGANRDNWIKLRKKLLDDFKIKYPERYNELYGSAK